VHDSYHERGFTDSYLLTLNGVTVGYGSVSGLEGARDVVKEFYVYPEWRSLALPLLQSIIAESRATRVEAQTNDPLLSIMFWDCATDVTSDTILFADRTTTRLTAPGGTTLRKIGRRERSSVFQHTLEPVGDWGLERDGQIVATGGLFFHYNEPYCDIYMEVAAPYQRQGLGSYLVQELKRIGREGGRTPSARCGSANVPSRLTLQRAGMLPCARILRGRLAT
jgi:GNAT superfamily N-acetyltransferase